VPCQGIGDNDKPLGISKFIKVKVEPPIADHLSNFAHDLEQYKAMQIFLM